MTKENIIAVPNPSLRKKSKYIKSITPEIRRVINNMIKATLDWDMSRDHEVGVALAAVQINERFRIVVIREDHEDKKNSNFKVYINPKIEKAYGDLVVDFEGCLSVPDYYGKVTRYNKVKVSALDKDLKPVSLIATGFLARIFQHEIDHTNGILFIDHIKDNEEAFYQLTDKGELEQKDYEEVKKNYILWK